MSDTFQPELFTLTRASDPETSRAAAASLKDVRASQRAVYALLREHGASTDERLQRLAALHGLQISPSGLRTRRHELTALGLVVDSGRTQILDTGRAAIVWEIRE